MSPLPNMPKPLKHKKLSVRSCTIFLLPILVYSIFFFFHFFPFLRVFSLTPLFLVVHCLYIFIFKRWLGPVGTLHSSFCIYLYVVWALFYDLFKVLRFGSYYYVDFGRWFFCLDFVDSNLIFCMDPLAIVSSLLVLILTVFALYFGAEYMYREAFINRLLYLLNMFATSVVFLFFSYDFFLILFSWECVGLFSFLLVNFYSSRIYSMKAALKTFVLSRLSDMFMFMTFIMSVSLFNSTDLSVIFLQTPFMVFHYIFFGNISFHFLTLYSLCLVMSGSIKSAQFFFHVWLPDAMEAPTPASALIHSSTLVVAGIYLIIRFSILFEFVVLTNYLLILLGGLTLAFGAITATFQNDIKKLVAYSTISQIGYLTCGCGFGAFEEVFLYLIVHAVNKAFLFVLVGYTVHFFSGNTDMRQMGGSYLYSFDISVLVALSGLNLAGLPYTTGFIAKEFLLSQVFRDDFVSSYVVGCWLVSFLFTPIYMGVLTFLVYFGPRKSFFSNYVKFDYTHAYTTTLRLRHKLTYDRPYFLHHVQDGNIFKYFQFFKLRYTSYQYTALTSKFASFVLFAFFLLISSCGEYLIYIIMNYSTLSDVITSSSFMNVKSYSTNSLTLTTATWAYSVVIIVLTLLVDAIEHLQRQITHSRSLATFDNSDRLLLTKSIFNYLLILIIILSFGTLPITVLTVIFLLGAFLRYVPRY